MIVIDGEQFKIDVLSVKRSADFLDKYAERLANGHLRRELIGVYFNYKLQFGPGLDRKEYARLWDKLTEPVEFHGVAASFIAVALPRSRRLFLPILRAVGVGMARLAWLIWLGDAG